MTEAFEQAFEVAMANLDPYYREIEIPIQLKYGLKGWLIQPNIELMRAICGRNILG